MRNCRSIALSVSLIALTPFAMAGEQPLAPGTMIVEQGKFSAKEEPLTLKVPCPEQSVGAKVWLEIASPSALDLDLEVYDGDPDESFILPKCISDNVGPRESCTLDRPGGGLLWAVIRPVGGAGFTRYRLGVTPIDEQSLRVHDAIEVWANGEEVRLSDEATLMRLITRTEEPLVVAITGRDRSLKVASEYDVGSPVYSTVLGERYMVLGEPLNFSKFMYEGFSSIGDPGDLLVEVGEAEEESRDPYGRRHDIAYALGSHHAMDYIIPFSGKRVDENPLRLDKKKTNRHGVIDETGPAVFPLVLGDFRVSIRVKSPYGFHMALCDRFGRTLDVGEKLVVNPWSGRDPAIQADVGPRSDDGENLYLLIFPSPFSPDQSVGEFMLITERIPDDAK